MIFRMEIDHIPMQNMLRGLRRSQRLWFELCTKQSPDFYLTRLFMIKKKKKVNSTLLVSINAIYRSKS